MVDKNAVSVTNGREYGRSTKKVKEGEVLLFVSILRSNVIVISVKKNNLLMIMILGIDQQHAFIEWFRFRLGDGAVSHISWSQTWLRA